MIQSPSDNDWPFEQPKNCSVFTTRPIMDGEHPIQIVYHDVDDGGWQFLSNTELNMEDAILVGLGKVAELDPSVLEIAHINEGFHAYRDSSEDNWIIEKTPEA
ncbi:hypothetical protein [Vibrio marisflavi]|uniref:DUF2185 domain-containing protein n=1 Tax=Vibrio marisflavi CECT 7928 TaxID=634439 RepID=A0ABM9A6F5_9VIBR|nr:hypothetical protein [Vibrio marisflavi]CAH0540917.1 hypothetical protein VMF7928_03233 [Vibrio marisflavi CECT 7928]